MKLKNKILSAIMMVAASMALISASAMAASVSFSPAEVEVKAGETFSVDVVTSDNTGVCALGFTVTGTNDTFTLTNVEDAALYANATHGNNLSKAEYGLAWWIDDMFETESTDSGKAVTLTYKVNDTVEAGSYTITIANDESTSMNIDGDVVDFGTATLNVTVVADEPEVTTTDKKFYAVIEKAKTNTLQFQFDDTGDGVADKSYDYGNVGSLTFDTDVTVGVQVTGIPAGTTLALTKVVWK